MKLDLSEGAACGECGRKLPESEMIAFSGGWICSTCKPGYFQKLQEGIEPGETPELTGRGLAPAGPGIRTAGYLIDWIFFSILQFMVIFVLAVALTVFHQENALTQLDALVKLLSVLIALCYLTLTTWLFGAPLGARIAGLRVVTDEGNRLGPLRALRRSVIFIVGTMTCFIAPLSVLAAGHLGIHDKLSGSRVVRRKKSSAVTNT